jgi:hypothetical protein
METTISDTVETVNNLQERLTDFQQLGQMEQVVMADESALSRKKILHMESAIPEIIQRITQQQETFARSVEGVLSNVKFPASVAAASARALGFFRDLVVWGSRGGSECVIDSAISLKIDHLNSNYTMDSERQAHATALHLALDLTHHSPVEQIETGTEFGSNVELF